MVVVAAAVAAAGGGDDPAALAGAGAAAVRWLELSLLEFLEVPELQAAYPVRLPGVYVDSSTGVGVAGVPVVVLLLGCKEAAAAAGNLQDEANVERL